jgi:hypothetical protein
MGLGYRRAAEFLPPIVVVALRAGQVQPSLPALENFPGGIDEPRGLRIVRDDDRLFLGLMRDICGQRQQILALERQGRRPLPIPAAQIDALLQIDRPAERGAVEVSAS